MSKVHLRWLTSLPAFEAAARHQSIQKGAGELHVTHAAVSRQLNKLERYIECRLFERSHRKITLTDDGEILFKAVSTGFGHIQRAVAQLKKNRNPERLVISVDPDFASLWLVPRLTEFYAAVPNTLVEIRAEKSILPLRDPQIDCAIHYAPAHSGADYGKMLFRSRLFPVCAKDFLGSLPLNSPGDLRHHVLLHDRSPEEWGNYLRNCGVAVDASIRVGTIFNETALCLDAAVRGQGLALGDDVLAATYLLEGRLVRVLRPTVLSKNAYYLAVSQSTRRHPSVDAFRNWLVAALARQSRRVDGLRKSSAGTTSQSPA